MAKKTEMTKFAAAQELNYCEEVAPIDVIPMYMQQEDEGFDLVRPAMGGEPGGSFTIATVHTNFEEAIRFSAVDELFQVANALRPAIEQARRMLRDYHYGRLKTDPESWKFEINLATIGRAVAALAKAEGKVHCDHCWNAISPK